MKIFFTPYFYIINLLFFFIEYIYFFILLSKCKKRKRHFHLKILNSAWIKHSYNTTELLKTAFCQQFTCPPWNQVRWKFLSIDSVAYLLSISRVIAEYNCILNNCRQSYFTKFWIIQYRTSFIHVRLIQIDIVFGVFSILPYSITEINMARAVHVRNL